MPRRNILYKRVYHSLCTRIFSGQIKPGEKLPAMLDLADEFRVSIITIRSTFKLLQELGLIRVSRGKEAVVIYDRENIRSKERLCQWVKNREKVINDVFQLTATILPNTLAFGATLVEPEDVEKLQIITERIESQREEPGALSLALVEFYSVLSELTKNDSFDSLMTACDAFSSMTMVAASQSDSFRSSYCAILRDYMPGVLARIHEDQRIIAKYIRGNILSIAALTVCFTVLAVAFVPVWTRSRAGKRLLYGRAALLAHSAFIFLSIGVIALAIDAPHGFENASVFIDLIHVHQYR